MLLVLCSIGACFNPESALPGLSEDESSTTGRGDDAEFPMMSGETMEDTETGMPATETLRGAEDAYLVDQGRALVVEPLNGLLRNDDDPADRSIFVDPLSAASTVQGGVIELRADGGFTYTPPSTQWWGEDGFVYELFTSDGRRASVDVRVIVRPISVPLALIANEAVGGIVIDGESSNASSEDVLAVGDVNGDGFDDVAITSARADLNGHVDVGRS